MKILIFSTVYFPEHFLINSFSSELLKLNEKNEVQVLTGLPNYPKGQFFDGYSILKGPYEEVNHGVQVKRTPIIPRGNRFLQLAFNYLSYVLSATGSLFRLKRPDIIFVFAVSPITVAIPAIFYKWMTGAPLVLWLQDLWPESLSAVGAFKKESFLYKMIGKLVKWIYANTDTVLIQSPQFIDNLKEFDFPIEKSFFVPNWAEEIAYTKEIPQWVSALPQNKFTVTFAGNMGLAQSLDTIVGAAKLLQAQSHIQFVLAGDGREYHRITDLCKSMGLKNVLFVGRKPVQDMGPLFNHSNALIVSLTKQEIFQKTIPAKTIQYLSAGRPIVSCAGGITNHIIIEAKAGVAVEPESPTELAYAILELSKSDADDLLKYGQCAKEYYERNFQKPLIIKKIYKILEDEISKNRGGLS